MTLFLCVFHFNVLFLLVLLYRCLVRVMSEQLVVDDSIKQQLRKWMISMMKSYLFDWSTTK